jgi:vacuolar-type H+-ATPase subunit E/Vma4
MMSTERFLEAMTGEARRQCASIVDASRNGAAERIAAAHTAAAERRKQAVEALACRHAGLEAQMRDQAAAEASRNSFMTRHTLVQESVAAAHERLNQMAEHPDFAETILVLLQESLRLADDAIPIIIQVPDLFQSTVKEFLNRSGINDAQVVSQDTPVDGVIVLAKDGSFRISNTLTLRLKQNAQKASALAYQRFFGAPENQL